VVPKENMYIPCTTFFNDFNIAPSGPGKGLATANEPRSSMIVFCMQQKSNQSLLQLHNVFRWFINT